MARYDKYKIDELRGLLSDQPGNFGRAFELTSLDSGRVIFFDPGTGVYDIEVGLDGDWTPLVTGVADKLHIAAAGPDSGIPAQPSTIFQLAESIRFKTVTRDAAANGTLAGYMSDG